MEIIAHIETNFKEKFGIPRQSGLVSSTVGLIVFEKKYRNPDALRGLEDFSHIWLLWQFSANKVVSASPTVRPPRLGGNVQKGVFATRSPYRPNPIGLSSVRIEKIELNTKRGPLIYVSGGDLMDKTPIYDIKPYIYTDCHVDAVSGFADKFKEHRLFVQMTPALESLLPPEYVSPIKETLALDPRPSYQNDPSRIYGMTYGDYNIKFKIAGDLLTITDIEKGNPI